MAGQAAHHSRWEGRNGDKDRLRAAVWTRLETEGLSVGPAWSRIPNFVGADTAARHLAAMPEWQAATIIKCNPDAPQIPVRLRALYDGKTVYAPVPELTRGVPFVKIDPARLVAKGVSFELAAVAQGFLAHGEPVEFEALPYLPFCVVGCVAVGRDGGRTGKGAGFADLELGIFRELDRIDAETRIVTTVHSAQIVAEGLVMEPHDSPLHAIATEEGLIVTGTDAVQPRGVDWPRVRPDQFASIPFLANLRRRLAQKPGA